MLERILNEHVFWHDGWCGCSSPDSKPITSQQWAAHVALMIKEAIKAAL